MSDLHKKALLSNPGLRTLPPKPTSSHKSADSTENKRLQKNKRDYTPISWSNYFDRYEDVLTENGQNSFRIYIKGDSGPVIFFLHGGGFSGLTWSLLSSKLVKQIKCQCYSLDIRGHGDTHTRNDEDLSIETMTKDVVDVINSLWPNDSPPILLVGHSMGGALAVHVAARELIKNLIALVVIDVVEGSALEALSSMQTFLQGRPKRFSSVEQAIEYNVRSGSIRNVESARVSIIGQLKKILDENPNESKIEDNLIISNQSHAVMQTEIAEEDEEEHEQIRNQSKNQSSRSSSQMVDFVRPESAEHYEWRIDLTKTEKYWKDWFKGLSLMFLNVHHPKLLLLAGVDRLDKDLMVGQMQGKFQMQILPLCGHAVHEDAPDDVADALSNFMIRHKFTEQLDSINPPRLSC